MGCLQYLIIYQFVFFLHYEKQICANFDDESFYLVLRYEGENVMVLNTNLV